MSSVLTSIAKVHPWTAHEDRAEKLCEETGQCFTRDPNNPEAVQALADLG